MKKLIIAAVAVLVLAGAGAGWYVVSHRASPIEMAKADLRKGDNRAAAIQLRVAVRDQPSNAEAHALLSQLQLAQGDPIAAEKEIKSAQALGWDKFKVLDVLSSAYAGQNKWKEILAEVPREGTTSDETASFLITRSLAYRGLNDLPAAKASIADAQLASPKNVQVWIVSARLEAANTDMAAALKDVDQALALDPNSVEALQLKAQLRANAGGREDALALLDRALAAAPANSALRLERATLEIGARQDAKARDDVKAVLAKEPGNQVASFMQMVLLIREAKYAEADLIEQKLDSVIIGFQRGLYFKAMIKANIGQLESAEDAIKTYVARNGQDADGIRLLGRIALAARRPQDAIPALRGAVTAGAADAETLDLLGRAYALNGDRNDAEAVFKRASAANNESASGLTRLASSRLQIGDLSGAATDLERSLEIAPNTPGAGETLVATALSIGDLDRAQTALDRLRQQTGDTEAVGVLTGLIKAARLDPDGALQSFKETAQKFPDSASARMNEARLLVQMGRRDEAIPVLQEVLSKTPANPAALSLLVQILVDEKKGTEAIAAVEAARKAQPTNLAIVSGEAELLARLGDVPRAMALLDDAKVNGVTPTALKPVLATLQLTAGQTDAAKATVVSLVQDQPGNLQLRIVQIDTLARLKDWQGARDAAQDTLRRVPGNPAIMSRMLAIELGDKGVEAALAMADRLRADPANMPGAAGLKGDLLMSQRRFSEAAAAFDAEFRAEPSSVLVLRLAGALQAAGDGARAMKELKSWQALNANDAAVAEVLAALELAQHRNADAERDLQIVLAQQPNNSAALNNLAWLLQLKGDKTARTYAQRAFMQSQSPETADTLGWVLVSQGDAPKAVRLLQQAAAARPDSRTIKYHLAVALNDTGKRDEAISILKPLAEDSAEFDEKAAAKQLLADLSKPR